MVIFDVDISHLLNKVTDCFNIATASCPEQGSPLMEREKQSVPPIEKSNNDIWSMKPCLINLLHIRHPWCWHQLHSQQDTSLYQHCLPQLPHARESTDKRKKMLNIHSLIPHLFNNVPWICSHNSLLCVWLTCPSTKQTLQGRLYVLYNF